MEKEGWKIEMLSTQIIPATMDRINTNRKCDACLDSKVISYYNFETGLLNVSECELCKGI